jgi:hypothetical protein
MHHSVDTMQRLAADHQMQLRTEAEIAHRATRSYRSVVDTVARWLRRPPEPVPEPRRLPNRPVQALDDRHPSAAA